MNGPRKRKGANALEAVSLELPAAPVSVQVRFPEAPAPDAEAVVRPSYYGSKGWAGRLEDDPYEVWKVLRAWGVENYWVCSAIAYLVRCGKKDDEVKELAKTVAYLQDELKARKAAQARKDDGE